MKRQPKMQALLVVLALSLTLPNVGCTKEKAEAVKNAAEQFRVEARNALSMTSDLTKQSVSMPAESKDEEIKRLVTDLTAIRNEADMTKAAQEVLKTGSESLVVNRQLDAEFKSVEDEYELFAGMFRSLTRGRFFAKDAVARAERHAVRLTLRFGKIADTLQGMPVQFSGRRTVLIDRLLAAQAVPDAAARTQAMTLAVQDLLQLRADERAAKERAIVQCLKAAEAGRLATELIQNYGKMTVGDMINLTKDSLAMLNDMTGGANKDVQGFQTRFESFVKNKISADPLWKDVLQSEVRWQKLLSGSGDN